MLNKRVICKKCEVANNPITRFKGLMFRKELEKGSALLIEPCNEIHTFSMKFPIDVVTLSKDNVVLTVFDSVPPSMVMPPVKTGRKVIELNAGDAKLLARVIPSVRIQNRLFSKQRRNAPIAAVMLSKRKQSAEHHSTAARIIPTATL